ncbi:MAG: YidC/Oxa1 family insertase periplasmic-domain containing protein, partial [bacterium]|nr:YidC/Oxa1 family insertase periplasmic-domain containing protein [bacterium]
RTSPRIDEDIASNLHRPSLRTTLGSLGSAMIPVGQPSFPSLMPTLNEDWEVHPLEVEGGQGIEFRYPLDNLVDASRPNKLDLVKRYRLLPAGTSDGYLLDLETRVVNRNDEAVQLSLRQEGLAGMTLEGWWYSVKISPNFFAAAGQRDVTYRAVNPPGQQIKTTRQIFDHAKDTPNQRDLMLFGAGEAAESRQLSYIGLDSQYFNASILPYDASSNSLTDLRRAAATSLVDIPAVEKSRIQAANTSFWFDSREQSIAPGSEFSQRYQIFIGPKESELLASHGLEQAIEYGWFPLVAKPLSAILHFFHAIVGNYGLAIVMLTVMVRGLMFPLGRKAAANAQKMQELQPELKRINDKYKDNMELRAKKMQELYAKHNFKPLAGCLPMFIQLPIFIGLYRCLSVDVSLRQEPLIPGLSWCSNLAGPDMLYNWSSWMPEFIAGKGTGWLGPYFNLLPILTVVLFIVQQKMLMPKATDEQTRMTQNMMQVMTVFMGVLFFKVPSGLCIYFITSSLWSLVERKLVKKTLPALAAPTAETPAATTGDKKTPSSATSRRKGNRDRTQEEKPSGRLQELMQMLEKPAVKSATQRGSSKRNPKKSRKQR